MFTVFQFKPGIAEYMPGMVLSFICPCGFKKNNINVGATETGHYSVYLCIKCANIFSLWEKTNKRSGKKCRKCKTALIAVTDAGAWVPKLLQQKIPETEPWMVVDELSETEDYYLGEDYESYINDIKILCPKCRKYSLTFEEDEYWD